MTRSITTADAGAAAPAPRRFERLALSAAVEEDGAWRSIGGVAGFDATIEPAHPQYQVQWTVGEVTRVMVRRVDGQPIRARRLRVTAFTPLVNFARVIVPDCGRFYVDALKALNIRGPQPGVTAPSVGHPFFALDDQAGRFLLAFGLLDAPGEVSVRRELPRLSQRRAMVGGDELLGLTFEWRAPHVAAASLSIDLFVAERQPEWFTALRRYTDLIKQREELVFPTNPAAWEPVWCTWNAFCSSDLTHQRLLANARIARELGVGSVIIDDGWFGPGLDDDRGVINHGDFTPDPLKFPDLPRTVSELQSLGLHVLLWHAPLCVAPQSRAASTLGHLLMQHGGKRYTSVNGLHQLCPACPQVREHVARETQRLLRDYGADGLKVDLYNCLPVAPCDSTEHEHDIDDPVLAVEATMAAQWQAARQVKPDALIELKQDYGAVRLVRHGTMLRGGDAGYDVDTNFRRCVYSQAYAPCVHADPLVTSIHDDPANVSLMMIKLLAIGVPMISMDLPITPEPMRRRMAAFLHFYNERRGRFSTRRRPQSGAMDVWELISGDEAVVAAVFSAHELTLPAARRVWLLNGTGRSSLRVHGRARAAVTTFSDLLEPVGQTHVSIDGDAALAIPSGGAVRLDVPA